jgi:hypothetical protein
MANSPAGLLENVLFESYSYLIHNVNPDGKENSGGALVPERGKIRQIGDS